MVGGLEKGVTARARGTGVLGGDEGEEEARLGVHGFHRGAGLEGATETLNAASWSPGRETEGQESK